MRAYLVRRLFLAIPTFFGITLVVFGAVRFLPGDVVDQIQGLQGSASPERRQALEEEYSLNQGIAQQYVHWMGDVLTGDLGESFLSRRPISDDLKQRIPITLELAVAAMLVALAVSMPIGIISGVRANTIFDYGGRMFAIFALSMPSFFVALLAIVYGYKWFGWIPPIRYYNLWEDPVANFNIMAVPALVLGFGLAGGLTRLMRSMMLEVMRQDYVRTARAKGLRSATVVLRHAVRNAMIPLVTVLGLQIAALLAGTVILEQIFSIPGMGQLLLTSITNRDYPVVQAIVLITGTVIVITNLVVDLTYAVIDPRIKY